MGIIKRSVSMGILMFLTPSRSEMQEIEELKRSRVSYSGVRLILIYLTAL